MSIARVKLLNHCNDPQQGRSEFLTDFASRIVFLGLQI